MNRITLYIILLALTGTVFSQKGYTDGTVILKTGDTLTTKVNLGNFKDMREIKLLKGKKKVKYRPGEIVSMEVGGIKYITQPLRLFSIEDEFKNDGFVFLEVVAEGEISLYKLEYCYKYSVSKDPRARGKMTNCTTIFYLLSDIRPYYFEAYQYDNAKNAMDLIGKKKQRYTLNELAGYFSKCEKISQAILYERIKRENIYDAVSQYNECVSPSSKKE